MMRMGWDGALNPAVASRVLWHPSGYGLSPFIFYACAPVSACMYICVFVHVFIWCGGQRIIFDVIFQPFTLYFEKDVYYGAGTSQVR